jgi:hypothetical protein
VSSSGTDISDRPVSERITVCRILLTPALGRRFLRKGGLARLNRL